MATFTARYQCQGVKSDGKMRKGAVKVTQCGNLGEVPVIAKRSANIPGVIKVTAGQQVMACMDCYRVMVK